MNIFNLRKKLLGGNFLSPDFSNNTIQPSPTSFNPTSVSGSSIYDDRDLLKRALVFGVARGYVGESASYYTYQNKTNNWGSIYDRFIKGQSDWKVPKTIVKIDKNNAFKYKDHYESYPNNADWSDVAYTSISLKNESNDNITVPIYFFFTANRKRNSSLPASLWSFQENVKNVRNLYNYNNSCSYNYTHTNVTFPRKSTTTVIIASPAYFWTSWNGYHFLHHAGFYNLQTAFNEGLKIDEEMTKKLFNNEL
jgi:hypothetical protein